VIRDLVTHVLVSSVILAVALAAARWIRPLTARTRHAILIAGMAAMALPAPVLAHFLERTEMTMVINAGAALLPPVLAPGAVKPVAPQVPWQWIAIAYFAIAVLLLLRWWLTTHRLVATAMRAATPPPPRAARALDAARRRLQMTHSVDLIASPTCEAPAVVRVFRPMIILPADGCDSLEDEELESLLCHECAHVARRDNLIGVCEAVVCSLFWFNPLVWLAHRRIAAAREAACDERVADAALPAETYVGALAKICRTLLAPRIPAVSCMASAHLKERIQHLMRYDTLRKSAFSHRLIAVVAAIVVFATVAGAGVVIAEPAAKRDSNRYQLNYSMNRTQAGLIAIRVRVVDSETGTVVGSPSVNVKPGEKAAMKFGTENATDGREWTILVDTSADASGTMAMRVDHNGVEEQVTRLSFPSPGAHPPAKDYRGAPISMDLANADIKDVLRTFGQLTGLQIVPAPDVQGTVNVHVQDMPWDQALDEILRENGLTWKLEGDKMYITKQ
jgi:beta-lactamase regulating signal transducer with metallopeptidase domain